MAKMFSSTWKSTALMLPSLFFLLSDTSVQVAAATCPAPVPALYPAPVVRDGFEARLVVSGLKKPRGVIVDSKGRLLVIEAGKGITHLRIKDDGWPCLSVEKTTTIVSRSDLNHGIELSIDGKTLYASSSNSVYSWAYDADAMRVSDEKSPKTLISNMTNTGGGHSTRTLLISRKQPGILLVSRGSGSNIDNGATDHSSGISQIRAFDISDPDLGTPGGGKVYDYPSEGWTIGWGLRNSVGVAEEPNTGGIYSVENSADGIKRFGVDIHEDSPGEEMNYHGVLRFPSSTSSNTSSSANQGQQQGGNHGYPYCLALYNSSASLSFPSLGNLKTGSQFTHDSTPYSIPFLPSSDSSASQAKPINITASDTSCSSTNFVPPRLTFPAHTAPLDIKFGKGSANQSLAYISFHGSWDRSTPAGYKLSAVLFDTSKGEPVEANDSTTSLVDVMWNRDVTQCPGQCFRPVGLAVDGQERIWMTDDDKGDVWVLKRIGEVKDDEGADGGSGSESGSVNGDSDSAAAPMRAKRSGSCAEWLGVGTSTMVAVVGSLLLTVL